MIGYATLGTNDIERARTFYDGLIGALGGQRVLEIPDARGFTMYGAGRDKPMLAITKPYDGAPATAGNGTMVALVAESREQVDSVHAKALALGATDEGAPGQRGPDSMKLYGAYFRDPDGNKFFVHKFG
ncbi:VOC family protein [Sphingomonas sp. CROZ-RG-20F-R02-07]|uniref:VOC family protein n=1 Tax=Sphingomonas sp. CROZ-RG-20F-R02-07 TaxID=2914832 RepID=UPI001F5967FA|nr:VOC family protein [Sphingomonas sp. CROZ-RG-20F-R02-07]